MMKMLVERKWARHLRGRRGKGRYVGFRTEWYALTSNADWHKKEFGHRWLKQKIWNAAALKLEYGFCNVAWAKKADIRFRENHIRSCRYNEQNE